MAITNVISAHVMNIPPSIGPLVSCHILKAIPVVTAKPDANQPCNPIFIILLVWIDNVTFI